MAASVGVSGFGAKFGIADTATTSITALAEITSISGPGMEAGDIDISHMASPDGFREFISGLVDAGQIDVELNYTADEATNLQSYWRTNKTWGVEFPDSTSTTAGDRSQFTFGGYLKSTGYEIPLDDKASVAASVKISGKPTFRKGSAA